MNRKTKTVREVGEEELVHRISKHPSNDNSNVILGIGDDAAVSRVSEGMVLVTTCDSMVEIVHFDLSYMTPYQVGRKVVSINLSDIASMGGRPVSALVSLMMPGRMPLADFDELYRGMTEQIDKYGASIIGGNMARSNQGLTVDLFMMGEVDPHKMLRRSTAKPDDEIWVTGHLGSSAVGLWLLQKFGNDYPIEFTCLVESHINPIPRVETAQRIADSGMATAMMDISDGLAKDLHRLCSASGVGAQIEFSTLPTDDKLNPALEQFDRNVRDAVLHGGEDYELLFTAKPFTNFDALSADLGLQFTQIGVITDARGGVRLVEADGEIGLLSVGGWDHFGKSAH